MVVVYAKILLEPNGVCSTHFVIWICHITDELTPALGVTAMAGLVMREERQASL
jgi:hypothetical protein